MEKNKKTKILHLNLELDRRLIFLSDIHGDVFLFKKILKEINFTTSDYLFINGDMIEKGDSGCNLAMLDYMLELNQLKNVFFVAGNCDEIFRFILPPVDKKRFLHYVLDKKKSIINDLAEKLNYNLTLEMDIADFVDKIGQKYSKYFDFIDSLPDACFINDKIILVHGGILDSNNISQYALDLQKFDNFMQISPKQDKLMIVGHYPTKNYHNDIACVNPIYDKTKNIISIDGGNNVVKGGQINVVIFENLNDMNYSYLAFDHYPKYSVKEDISYQEPQKKINISFKNNEVDILAKDLDFYLIRLKDTNDEMWVNEDFIFKIEDKHYCYEGCNTFLNLKKGDKISIIKKANPYSLIKYQGLIGLIETKYINEI